MKRFEKRKKKERENNLIGFTQYLKFVTLQ